jgi:aspartate carbamoyltransferase
MDEGRLQHLTTIKSVPKALIDELLISAEEMKKLVRSKGGDNRLQHKVLALAFYEPSTRTNCSFQAAMLRLGGSILAINEETSSVKKGESLEDTIITLACYTDAIILRHPMKGSATAAASLSSKPIINAGDGVGEHPTQALLDLFTIKTEMGYIGTTPGAPPMVVTLLGDLLNGRTVHSLVRVLAQFSGIRLILVSPPELALPNDIIEELKSLGTSLSWQSLEDAIPSTDVLYVTRIQKERFSNKAEYDAVSGSYIVNTELMKNAKSKMIVMHPLPRLQEISTDFDTDPRAAYFRQMENGMYLRMALLDYFLGKK